MLNDGKWINIEQSEQRCPFLRPNRLVRMDGQVNCASARNGRTSGLDFKRNWIFFRSIQKNSVRLPTKFPRYAISEFTYIRCRFQVPINCLDWKNRNCTHKKIVFITFYSTFIDKFHWKVFEKTLVEIVVVFSFQKYTPNLVLEFHLSHYFTYFGLCSAGN